jgi:hypothetical protein
VRWRIFRCCWIELVFLHVPPLFEKKIERTLFLNAEILFFRKSKIFLPFWKKSIEKKFCKFFSFQDIFPNLNRNYPNNEIIVTGVAREMQMKSQRENKTINRNYLCICAINDKTYVVQKNINSIAECWCFKTTKFLHIYTIFFCIVFFVFEMNRGEPLKIYDFWCFLYRRKKRACYLNVLWCGIFKRES